MYPVFVLIKSKKRKGYDLLPMPFACPGLIGHPHGLSDTQATGGFAEHNMPMFIFKLKMNVFMAVLGLHCCMGFSLVVESGAALWLWCLSFSLWWLLLPRMGFRD